MLPPFGAHLRSLQSLVRNCRASIRCLCYNDVLTTSSLNFWDVFKHVQTDSKHRVSASQVLFLAEQRSWETVAIQFTCIRLPGRMMRMLHDAHVALCCMVLPGIAKHRLKAASHHQKDRKSQKEWTEETEQAAVWIHHSSRTWTGPRPPGTFSPLSLQLYKCLTSLRQHVSPMWKWIWTVHWLNWALFSTSTGIPPPSLKFGPNLFC